MAMPWILRYPTPRVLLAVVGVWAFAFGLTIPFLTLTARDLGASVGAIGVIAASFLAGQWGDGSHRRTGTGDGRGLIVIGDASFVGIVF